MTNTTSQNKPPLILIGASGLIGSRLAELFSASFTVEGMGITSGLDITDASTLVPILRSEAKVVVHLAAKADVDGCEQDRALGEDGDAWKINVAGARNVARACRESGKKMMYFSTDFVFDGKKELGDSYTEEDRPNPLNWYAQTKYEGELSVAETLSDHVILRTAYPYRADFSEKKDFVRAIKSNLETGKTVQAITDHVMCPTFIDDMVGAISLLIEKDEKGIFNMSGSSPVTPYEAAKMIAKEFSLNEDLIEQTTREKFFKDRAERPYNISMKNDKILKLGAWMNPFEKGLKLMHEQLI